MSVLQLKADQARTTTPFSAEPPLGLYFHIPFCVKKCPYCDFNSYAVGLDPELPEQRYVAALIAEMKHHATHLGWAGRECSTLFFGGGTPSLFSGSAIADLIAAAGATFQLSDAIEITLEANPGTIDEALGLAKLKAFRAAGVNRISFGSQSFSPRKLKALGRLHQPEDIERAVNFTREAGFSSFNLDLIFGVKDEITQEWCEDLERVLGLEPDHISAYGLTIEPGTIFYRQKERGIIESAHEEQQAEFFRITQQRLSLAGYHQYEISNYAREGMECRHNLNYWGGGDYLGLGAGAHSFQAGRKDVSPVRWSNVLGPLPYMNRAIESGDAIHQREVLSSDQEELEFLFLGFRRRDGISFSRYRERFNLDFIDRYSREIEQLRNDELIEGDTHTIRLTSRGFLFLDSVLSSFASA